MNPETELILQDVQKQKMKNETQKQKDVKRNIN